MNKLIFLVAFFASNLKSQSMVISEVFANPKGRGGTSGQQWIEIKNVTFKKILLENLQIKIFPQDEFQLEQSLEKKFSSPIFFHNYLVIAQKKNLGFEKCLDSSIQQIIFEELKLPKREPFTICITMNFSMEYCSDFANKNFFSDGKSKEIIFDHEKNTNAFKDSSCEIENSSFASPGLPSNFCKTNPKIWSNIFSPCEKNDFTIKNSYFVEPTNVFAPQIKEIKVFNAKEKIKVKLKIDDQDQNDRWTILLCERLETFENCPLKIETLKSQVQIELNKKKFLEKFQTKDKLFLRVADQFGKSDQAKLSFQSNLAEERNFREKNFDLAQVKIVFKKNVIEIQNVHIPMIFIVENSKGEAFISGALENGTNFIELPLAREKFEDDMFFRLVTIKGERRLPIFLLKNSKIESASCSNKGNQFFFLHGIALYYLLCYGLRKSIKQMVKIKREVKRK